MSIPSLLRVVVVAALLSGCRPGGQPPVAAGGGGDADAPGGAELWSASCRRCHAMRGPAEYGAEDWNVVMMHMRVRANLTGAETRAIVAFLRSGR
jgi:hypothetical protein